MKNPFTLEYEGSFAPGQQIRFEVGEGEMPTQVDFQNNISELIESYYRHPHFFDPFDLEIMVSDLYYFLVNQYQYVLQYYLQGTEDSRFLVIHYDFIYNHFIATLQKRGSSRPDIEAIDLLQHLYFHLTDGDDIDLPTGFKSQKEIIQLFSALKELYQGNPSKYLEIL